MCLIFKKILNPVDTKLQGENLFLDFHPDYYRNIVTLMLE